jgi:transglutaminase-like putative cysteine protease
MLACLFVLIVTPRFAGAQESDYSSDDTPDALTELADLSMAQSAPMAEDATLGVSAQALDFALAQSPTNSTGPAAGVPARFLRIDTRFDVHANGSSTTTSHVELQLLSPQAVTALAQPALAYSDSLQDLQITNAYTLKPDGTKLPVAPDAILVRQKAMPSPFFSDLKEKVILFPNVEPGDTLVYDSVIRSQARIPGQFYFGAHIPRVLEIDSDTITFVTPKSFPLTFDPYGFAVQKTAEGGNLVYTIHYANRMPVLELPQFLSDMDHGQRVFASSVGTFDALAAGYAPLISPKLAVTTTIIAKANEITAGITDRREQARKLYEWVSAHVRYIALFFGDGGIVPHTADSILANGYGDCKDHTVLYSALLKAKGIASEPVIINATNGYFLPQVPQLLTFNHMIVWLPEFGLYADTTSNTTSFGALPPTDYGKPVIRVGGDGGALQHTPLLTEADATYSSSSALKLDSDGKLSGTHSATATGALSGVLRGMANQAGALGLNSVVQAVLRARKMDSATGSLTFAPTVEMTPQYTYSSNFQFARALQSDAGFAPPEGLNLVDAYSPALFGPVADARFLASDSLPCFSGKIVDDYTLEFPADKKLVSLPPDGLVQSTNIDYRSHWSLTGNTLSIHRELHAHFDKALCTGAALQETRAAIGRIQKDYGARIAFATAQGS